MITKRDKNNDRLARHARVRKKVSGTADRPRFSVYRSLSNIYVQIIDDAAGNTLVSASTMEPEIKAQVAEMTKTEAAALVGKIAAQRAADKGIKEVVFDRGGYVYTGRVASVAAGAREAGLEF
ncbi:MAG: 50S ribosomal protein L18 [Firmicutes bacterium]|nr:50S ribosomal protein L18 [Bacillota bacterium]